MASLVADYGTDSENEDDLAHSELSDPPKTEPKDEIKTHEWTDPTRGNKFFSADADENESESEDEQQEGEHDQVATNPSSQKMLPNPMARGHSSSTYIPTPCSFTLPKEQRSSESSVFVNQYQKAEDDKWSVLEQHVKMTTTNDLDKSAMKKKVCVSFQRGKCRFGKKCSFSHSNEVVSIQKRPEIYESEEDSEESKRTQQQNKHSYYGMHANKQHFTNKKEDDDSYMANAKRKYRAGVSNNLKPPKKAMMALNKQRESERPWTTSNYE